MKFGDEEFDKFVDKHMRRAVAQTGYQLKRADDQQKAGLIDAQMRLDIKNARFVIADLTHGSHGAYWEAGYAEGLGKPVIYTCRADVFEKENGTHFDTNHHVTIKWSYNDPKPAMDRLKATIRYTIPEAKQHDN
ncbi:MAG: hypothetical protein EAZ99_04750 [Alphaproteobacteria bacterium]|nr:MAG: hypothetical protein EAZ99_04750 [Alphaproteobacteria bacterium]